MILIFKLIYIGLWGGETEVLTINKKDERAALLLYSVMTTQNVHNNIILLTKCAFKPYK